MAVFQAQEPRYYHSTTGGGMFEKLSLTEVMMFNTTRIECTYRNGDWGTGTGFFFTYPKGEDSSIQVLVTNKHVTANAQQCVFRITRRSDQGAPILGQSVALQVDNIDRLCIPHPDPNVDLCLIPLSRILVEADNDQNSFFYSSTEPADIPSADDLEQMEAIETVIMVGYPMGIWDNVNNMPVMRRGITATHPALDYRGRSEVLLDIACFPGSSGSPVYANAIAGPAPKKGIIFAQQPLKLLGIAYAIPEYTANGEVQIVDIPTANVPMVVRVPSNLGYMIRSSKLLDFVPIVEGMG